MMIPQQPGLRHHLHGMLQLLLVDGGATVHSDILVLIGVNTVFNSSGQIRHYSSLHWES